MPGPPENIPLSPERLALLTHLRFAWRVAGFLASTILCWCCFEAALLLAGKRRRIQVINRWVPRWAGFNLWLFGVTTDAQGPLLENQNLVPGCDATGRGRIFIANHRSGMDIPLLFSLVAAHCISRHDLAQWPLVGQGARRIGTLFVDRKSRRSGAAVLKQIAHAVDNGEGVAMFPEGTSHAGDEVHPFRPGAFNAAKRTGAQLVPIGIAYKEPAAYYVDDSFLMHVKRIAGLKKLEVAVQIGLPIDTDSMDRMQLAEQTREQVQQLVLEARTRLDR